jgi:hypothetical protein
MCDGA